MGIQRDEDSLLIADTLVVVFSGEGKELIGLDAYANQEHWRRSASMKLPEISGVGRVCLVEDLAHAFCRDQTDNSEPFEFGIGIPRL
jgi:hypothetical protein